jgi:hypothetical protein
MKRLFAGLYLLSGCYASVHYHAVGWGYWGYGYGHASGAFSTSYGETGIVWNAPQGANAPPAVMQNDEPVEGSDGTFGFRRTGNADAEIHRLSALVAQKCKVEKYGYDETQALCGNMRVLLRRDDRHVYLLCAPGADRKACERTWVSVLGG